MKITITDKFLWDLYQLLDAAGDAVEFLLSNHYRKASLLMNGKNPVFEKYRNELNGKRFSKLVYELKRKGYVKSHQLRGRSAIMLTRRGVQKALRAKFSSETEGKQKRKDGKWVMIIFDIPQQYKKSRALMRNILQNLGYELFQQSVWITPHDVSDETEKLLLTYSLDEFVRIFLIEKIA